MPEENKAENTNEAVGSSQNQNDGGSLPEGATAATDNDAATKDTGEVASGTGESQTQAKTLLETASDVGKPSETEAKDNEGNPAQAEEAKLADLTSPEGFSVDTETTGTMKAVAEELHLSQEQAQGIVDKMTPVIASRQMQMIKETTKQWEQRTLASPEFQGAAQAESIAAVARVRDRFGRNPDGTMDPDVQELLGLPIGNHPGLLKLLARAGKAIGEAGYPSGTVDNDRPYTATDFYKDAQKR